jgi:hypothetical protein
MSDNIPKANPKVKPPTIPKPKAPADPMLDAILTLYRIQHAEAMKAFKALPKAEQKRRIEANAGPKVKCLKCNHTIRSMHRHHYMRCNCGSLFVDGGSSYLRMGAEEGTYKIYPKKK